MSPLTVFWIAFAAIFTVLLIPCLIWYIPWHKRKKEEQRAEEARRQRHSELEKKYGAALTPELAGFLDTPYEQKREKISDFICLAKAAINALPVDAKDWLFAPSALSDGGVRLHRKENELLYLNTYPSSVSVNTLKNCAVSAAAFEAALQEGESALDAAIIREDEKRHDWDGSLLKDMSALENCTVSARLLTMDDVVYFDVTEHSTSVCTTRQTSSVNGSQTPGMLGTAMNEALFGTAYATAKAVQKVNAATSLKQETTTSTRTEKEATVYFRPECGLRSLTFSPSRYIEEMMPEKRK